jgi:hypothetical protein
VGLTGPEDSEGPEGSLRATRRSRHCRHDGNALESISNITGRFYFANADYLDNTGERLLCLFDEAYTDTDHPPIVVHHEVDQGAGSHGTTARILLDPLAAGSLAAATDAARRQVGLPIKWSETDSDGAV